MMKRKPVAIAIQEKKLIPLIRLWILRILVPLNGQLRFVNKDGFSDDTFAEALGLGEYVDQTSTEFDPKIVRNRLRQMHQDEELKSVDLSTHSSLQNNLMRLADLAGLSDTDCRILEFSILLSSERMLDDLADLLGHLSTVKTYYVLSILLDIPEPEVRRALNPQGILAKSGLIVIDSSNSYMLRSKFNLLSGSFADNIVSTDSDPINLLKDMVSLSSMPVLKLDDYGHITNSLDILRPYLRQSVLDNRKGVNIFIYGSPGTGKSQLAKVIAKELDYELFEIASTDGDGDPIDGARRLRAFQAAQSFFSQRKSLILFDEVEDVFRNNNDDDRNRKKASPQSHKAWLNNILEGNPVPALWLSNSIRGLDPAFIRRFDMLIELPVPPKAQRARIIKNACADILSPQDIERISRSESLAPAVVAKVASVVRSISDDLGAEKSASALVRMMSATLEAQGHAPILKDNPNSLPDIYDPAFIQADSDLSEVAAGLLNSRSGRLCLYGPPGTGKTAYGRWLSEQLGVPLIIKRASDLMSMWVGENEKNIAKAFTDAEQENAVLLIDEVDSFLQDRTGAQRGWEVSMVNEMLTQMESFSGVFIASTNLMDGLDQAALRRFDLKVKFDFMKPAQSTELFRRHCRQLGLGDLDDIELARLSRLSHLTPGDFAAVIRQNRFRVIKDVGSFLKALEMECAVKSISKASIGFI